MESYEWNKVFKDVPSSFHNKVEVTLNHLPEKEENIMGRVHKKMTFKKGIVLALAATMLCGTTVFATGKIASIVGRTDLRKAYTQVPTIEQQETDLGFSTVVVEKFSNGYTFNKGYKENLSGEDNVGNAVENITGINIDYQNGKKEVALYVDEKTLGDTTENVVGNYNGIDLHYSLTHYVFVPVDYEMTDEEKAMQDSGEIVFSYGSQEREEQQIQSLTWEIDGHLYDLIDSNQNLTQEEMIQMAQEVIEVNSK